MRVAIITGAARGIGRAIAERLASSNWQIVCADIDPVGNLETSQRVGGDAITCDVGNEADISALIDQTVAKRKRLDAIVSNAGINQVSTLSEWTLAQWNRVIAVNLTSSFLLARAGEPHLRRANGAMVLIASTRAHMSEPDTFAYTASKGGIVALTHSLAMSLRPDVRVNCISPGWIDTGKHGPISEEDHSQHPAGRVGLPEDVAAAAEFLLDRDRSGFMTGQEIIIDGGMTRQMIYA
ncbi:MAG: SDR family oxidoreductase [Hyphomicrobiaceae bacterium]